MISLNACDLFSQNTSSAGSSCRAGKGATGNPKTIEEVVELVNSLPKPLSIPCFLESLNRPLEIFATNSRSSVQPAVGEIPRVFIFKGPLVISVAPEGPGQSLVEVSHLISDYESVKGELAFPVNEELSKSAAYEGVLSGSGTRCSACHFSEHNASDSFPSVAYASQALRPSFTSEVSIDSLRSLAEACNSRR